MSVQGQWNGDWQGQWFGPTGAGPTVNGGARSLLAFWAGGASAGITPVAGGGTRSLLAFWAGGASAGVAPVSDGSVRSLLAFWAGGASAGITPIPVSGAQSGVRRLSQHLWKPQKQKIPRELLEQIQADALVPPKAIAQTARLVIGPIRPKPEVVEKSAIVYRPRIFVAEDARDFIFQKLNDGYLQSAEARLKYERIRDKVQAAIDDEHDIELLLLMH